MSKSIRQQLMKYKPLDEKVYNNKIYNNNSIRAIVCKLNKELSGFRFITWRSIDKKYTHIRLLNNETIKQA